MSDIDRELEKQYQDEYGFDPWETTSGLPDQITVRVTNPHFGYTSEFQDGQACLFFLEGQVIAGDADPEFSQWFTVGKGWETDAKGTRLTPEDGKKRRLNNQTNYAHLFASLREAAEKQGMANDLRHRGAPFEAKLWDGLELYLEREEYTFTIDNEKRNSSRLNVSSIEKMPGVQEKAKVRSVVGAQGDPTPDTPPEAVAGGDLTPMLKAKLRKLAQTIKGAGGSHNDFAEQAFSDVDGVLDNAPAEDAVMDTEAGSIWAEA